MTRQDYKNKIINSIIFKTKITDKTIIEVMHKTDNLDELMQFYITVLPQPQTLKDSHNQFAWIRKYSLPLIKRKGKISTHLYNIKKDYNKFVKNTEAANISDFTPEQHDTYILYLEVKKMNCW